MRSMKITTTVYLGCLCTAIAVSSLTLSFQQNLIFPSMFPGNFRRHVNLQAKMAYLKENIQKIDIVYFGDSRTYCAFDPEILDPALGRRSFNAAYWATWFPTQLAFLREVVPLWPRNTMLVWSIGHQNFQPVHKTIETAYGIGLSQAFRMLNQGFTLTELSTNLLASQPYMNIFHLRQNIATGIRNRLKRNIFALHGNTPSNQSKYNELASSLTKNHSVSLVKPRVSESTITSAEVFKWNGNYTRIEIQSEFFRKKQQENERDLTGVSGHFEPDPRYMLLFEDILQLLIQNDVNVIVNELPEAPYFYRRDGATKFYSEFMEQIKSFVEKSGVPYIRLPLEKLTDSDYFDYNHLNSNGIKKFSKMFSKQLRDQSHLDAL